MRNTRRACHIALAPPPARHLRPGLDVRRAGRGPVGLRAGRLASGLGIEPGRNHGNRQPQQLLRPLQENTGVARLAQGLRGHGARVHARQLAQALAERRQTLPAALHGRFRQIARFRIQPAAQAHGFLQVLQALEMVVFLPGDFKAEAVGAKVNRRPKAVARTGQVQYAVSVVSHGKAKREKCVGSLCFRDAARANEKAPQPLLTAGAVFVPAWHPIQTISRRAGNAPASVALAPKKTGCAKNRLCSHESG